MPGKIISIIPVTPDLSIILHQAQYPTDGVHISIKQNEKVNNLPGEITLIPEEIPALVKALTEASRELTKLSY
mgnify:CR=1 FL=1